VSLLDEPALSVGYRCPKVTLPQLEALRDTVAKARDDNDPSLLDLRDVFTLIAFAEHHVRKVTPLQEKPPYGPHHPFVPACGWAVVRRSTKRHSVETEDQTNLMVVQVDEAPGHTGPVTRSSTGKKHEQVGEMVQSYRDQARAVKMGIVKEKKIPRVTSFDHWDCGPDYDSYTW
jgi:hypothetical protein